MGPGSRTAEVVQLPAGSSRAWLALAAEAFCDADADDLVRRLLEQTDRHALSNTPQQTASWRESITALQRALGEVAGEIDLQGLLIEFPLQRLRRRIDAVVLRGDVAVVIEFKGGEGSGLSGAVAQVEDYALCLRDFHEPSRDLTLVPIAAGGDEGASTRRTSVTPIDQVTPVITLAMSELSWALRLAHGHATPGVAGPTLAAFDRGAYLPTPDIVQAAKEAYAEHDVAAIRRSDASGRALQRARFELRTLVAKAREDGRHVICFVTGTPGAGKTLLGLDLVLADQVGRDLGEAAAFLSGNRPLVQVLREALLQDEVERTGGTKRVLRRKVDGALQTLLDYLREYTADPTQVPVEGVVVFDEAQRAWDADTGKKLLGRQASEPELFLEIMERRDWACLVCLVGGGQEINKGEAGLTLWLDALRGGRSKRWQVVGPAGCVDAGEAALTTPTLQLDERPALALTGSLRAYRNAAQTAWLTAMLDGDLHAAAAHARQGETPPAVLTRSLDVAKDWLRARCRAGRRVGLLASSGARRLVAEGLPPTMMSNDLTGIAHWFLQPPADFRSSSALELPQSEYGVQGLELDYAGVCWGGDLVWTRGRWQARAMRAPRWTTTHDADRARFTINSYRVLLSRSRAGQVIFVPRGSSADPTRDPRTFDAIADALRAAGCDEVA